MLSSGDYELLQGKTLLSNYWLGVWALVHSLDFDATYRTSSVWSWAYVSSSCWLQHRYTAKTSKIHWFKQAKVGSWPHNIMSEGRFRAGMRPCPIDLSRDLVLPSSSQSCSYSQSWPLLPHPVQPRDRKGGLTAEAPLKWELWTAKSHFIHL